MLYAIELSCIYHISSLRGHIQGVGHMPKFLNGSKCARCKSFVEVLANCLFASLMQIKF